MSAKVVDQTHIEDEPKNWFVKHGVTLRFFEDFIDQNGGRKFFQNKTTSQICTEIIKPQTADKHISFCDFLSSHSSIHYKPSCNYFISHPWSATFLDVVDVLQNYFRNKDSSDVVVWFDLFSANQHLGPAQDFGFWTTTFKEAIKEIKNVVLVVVPAMESKLFKRAWCLFEIYCAILADCDIYCAFLPDDEVKVVSGLIEEGNEFLLEFSWDINIKQSEGRVEDVSNIHGMIVKDVGFHVVDYMIVEQIRKSLETILLDQVHRIEKDIFGGREIEAIQDSEIAEVVSSSKENLLSWIRLKKSLGSIYENRGDISFAERVFLECQRVCGIIPGDGHCEEKVVITLHLSNLAMKTGYYSKALKYVFDAVSLVAGIALNNPEGLTEGMLPAMLISSPLFFFNDAIEGVIDFSTEKMKSVILSGTSGYDSSTRDNITSLMEVLFSGELSESISQDIGSQDFQRYEFIPLIFSAMLDVPIEHRSDYLRETGERLSYHNIDSLAPYPERVRAMRTEILMHVFVKRFREALHVCEDYLKLLEERIVINQSSILNTLEWMVRLHEKLEELSEAEELLTKWMNKLRMFYHERHISCVKLERIQIFILSKNQDKGMYITRMIEFCTRRIEYYHPGDSGSMCYDLSSDLKTISDYFIEKKDYKKALNYVLKSFEILHDSIFYGPPHPFTLNCMIQIAWIQHHLNNLHEALQWNSTCYSLCDRQNKELAILAIEAQRNMAIAYQKKGSYEDAFILFQRCYDLRSDRTHKNFDEALMIQSAIDLIRLSENTRMEDDFLKKLFTTIVHYYRNNPQTDRDTFYSILFQFGLFLHRREEYDECCRCQEEGLQLAIELYTKENIHSLYSMRNLALTYNRLQRTVEYRKLIPECYEISCRVLGDTDPFTMSVAQDRVLQMAAIGQYSDALPLAENILEQLTKRNGEDHGETIQALITLGCVQSKSGNRKKAIEHYSKALAQRILTLGPDNFYTIDLTHFIAELLIREGRLEEAHEILISFLPRVRTIPQMKTHYAQITYLLGAIAIKQKKFSDAVEILQESWGVVSKLYDSKHPGCIRTMVACGKAFCKVGEMKRGSQLLHDAWALQSQTLGSNHPQTLEVLKLIQSLNLPLEI